MDIGFPIRYSETKYLTKLGLFIFSFKAQESQRRRILAEDNLLRREQYLKYESSKRPKD